MSKHPFLDINMQLQKYKIIIIHSEIFCITWVIPKSAHFTVEDKEIQSCKMISRYTHQKWISWVLVPCTVCFSGCTVFIESSQYSYLLVYLKWLQSRCPHLCTLYVYGFLSHLEQGSKEENLCPYLTPGKEAFHSLSSSCVVAGYGPRSCARQLLCCWAVPYTHPSCISVSLHRCSH